MFLENVTREEMRNKILALLLPLAGLRCCFFCTAFNSLLVPEEGIIVEMERRTVIAIRVEKLVP